MMQDIVERLCARDEAICHEAADKIERLREENVRLEDTIASLEDGIEGIKNFYESFIEDDDDW